MSDLLDAMGMPAELVRITTTGGAEPAEGAKGWRLPKAALAASLLLLVEADRLRWVAEWPEAGTLAAELGAFQVRVTPGLCAGYGHPAGQHDDLVLALHIACRAGEHAALPLSWVLRSA